MMIQADYYKLILYPGVIKKVVAFFLLYLFLLTPHTGFADQKFKMCAANSPPWTMPTDDLIPKAYGIVVNIMTEMFSQADLSIQMDILPFRRCLNYVKEGVQDGSFMIIKNAKREEYAIFTDPYLYIPTYLFYDKDRFSDFQWNAWENLQGYHIGIQQGFRYGQAFTSASERLKLRLEPTAHIRQSIEKLLAGRIDFVLVNKARFKYLADKDPKIAERLRMADKPVSTGKIYFAISKKSPAVKFIPKLNEIIEKMTMDGSIETIVDSGI